MTITRTEILTIQTDKEIILIHCLEIIHNIKYHKTIEVAHLNIKDKLTKYNQLKKLNQTLPVLITRKKYAFNKHASNLKIKEYETPIESNFCQNNNNHFQDSDKT